jgi:GT2 family glycosyltransferase
LKTKLAIVILNWNGLAYLKKFLPFVLENSKIPHVEIWVADNSSRDGSVEFLKKTFPEVSLLEFDRNYGFSGGYNKALSLIDAEYYILLNSDVEVSPAWLPPLLELMESNAGVAACMPKIKDVSNRDYFEHAGASGGFIDFLGYPFCRGRIFNVIEKDTGQYDDEREIFWASGACMMVRAADWNGAGGFDEKFFAHMEEIDLCWRLKNTGKSIRVVPSSVVYHIGGGTLPVNNPKKTWFNFRNSLLMLMNNLPSGRLYLLFVRLMLDWLSVIKFLTALSFSNAFAVLKAHISFIGLIPEYYSRRRALMRKEKVVLHREIYSKSIVFRFFTGGGKYFSRLGI